MAECETRYTRREDNTRGNTTTYREVDRNNKPTGNSIEIDRNNNSVTATTRDGGSCRDGGENARRTEFDLRTLRDCRMIDGAEVCRGSLGELRSTPARNCFKREENVCRAE